MANLHNYMNDGACAQAQATLAYLRDFRVEESWSDQLHRYMAEVKIARWENCREQGYVLSLHNPASEQLNIAFFEHRNSDSICAVMWKQFTFNAPTIDTAEFGDVYKDKYDVSHSVRYGEALKMADWIKEQLTKFWVTGQKAQNKKQAV